MRIKEAGMRVKRAGRAHTCRRRGHRVTLDRPTIVDIEYDTLGIRVICRDTRNKHIRLAV